uniref:DNA mismatch repair protein MSH6-1 n=1 Tax=Populus alba TaxID=43335 RepID=A0A4V6AAR7_POPAL|nr:DNA mismatch repair protein MSH6-1 [Populus alba]
MTDASERFSTREAEKFPFPGRERRDAKRRRPGDVDYDPRTLYLPAEFAKSLTEQTETPEQLELRRKEKGSKDKVVKREICAVITKGTLSEGELLSANPDASYLMAVTASHQSLGNQGLERIFGVCVVDITTSRIILGQFGDDAECSSLRCLLYELRAVEIVKPAKMLSTETERVMVRHTRNPLVNELASLSEFWDAKKTVQEVKTIYKHIGDLLASGPLNKTDKTDLDTTNLNVGEYRPSYLPNILSEFYESLALSALGGALYYLKQTFLDETLLRFAKFDSLPCSDFCEVAKKSYMILDAAALENIEIF